MQRMSPTGPATPRTAGTPPAAAGGAGAAGAAQPQQQKLSMLMAPHPQVWRTPVQAATLLADRTPMDGEGRPIAAAAARDTKRRRSTSENARKKTARACLYCQRSHMLCDEGRPCERCVRRGLSQLCRDGERKHTKYLGEEATLLVTGVPRTPLSSVADQRALGSSAGAGSDGSVSDSGGSAAGGGSSSRGAVRHSDGGRHPFVSDAMNQEFSVISDIVTAPIESSLSGVNLAPEMGIATQQPSSLGADPSTDSVYDRVTEPYSYAQGFHHLLSFAKHRMDKDDMLRICRALVSFRPPFIATVTNLSRQDLIFMEKCFQRTILEFNNNLLTYIGTPTCVWRRTGELALVGKEFALLTHWATEDLVGKSTFIYELMDNRSTVDYWEKYASVVLDNSQQSVISKCNLLRPDRTVIPCTACYTIKRDIFDVPLCVVGNFLPILSSTKW